MGSNNGYSVSCQNVCYSPPSQNDRKILNGINLEVNKGEFVSIIGENGCGKSTLLRAITGEIELSGGTIQVGGQHISGPIHKKIRGVGIVHQNLDEDFIFAYSVAMNVAFRQVINKCHPNLFWATNNSYKADLSMKLARYMEKAVDIDTLVQFLSGGERQMLNLVVAIHLEHEKDPCGLILLDEHTSKLDLKKSGRTMKFTHEQITASGSTAIMVTHKLGEAHKYSEKVFIMRKGKIVGEYNTKEITLRELESEFKNGKMKEE